MVTEKCAQVKSDQPLLSNEWMCGQNQIVQFQQFRTWKPCWKLESQQLTIIVDEQIAVVEFFSW